MIGLLTFIVLDLCMLKLLFHLIVHSLGNITIPEFSIKNNIQYWQIHLQPNEKTFNKETGATMAE